MPTVYFGTPNRLFNVININNQVLGHLKSPYLYTINFDNEFGLITIKEHYNQRITTVYHGVDLESAVMAYYQFSSVVLNESVNS